MYSTHWSVEIPYYVIVFLLVVKYRCHSHISTVVSVHCVTERHLPDTYIIYGTEPIYPHAACELHNNALPCQCLCYG